MIVEFECKQHSVNLRPTKKCGHQYMSPMNAKHVLMKFRKM